MFEESHSLKWPFDQCLPRERSPFSPSGEKVADRPDEGAFLEGSVLKRPPRPGPLPQFFARTLPCDATQYPQTNGGEGEIWRCPGSVPQQVRKAVHR
jgi:hypothetical protein